jgi:hypothetical protein
MLFIKVSRRQRGREKAKKVVVTGWAGERRREGTGEGAGGGVARGREKELIVRGAKEKEEEEEKWKELVAAVWEGGNGRSRIRCVRLIL